MSFNVLSCFQQFYIATFSIFTYNFLLQFLTSIAQNVKVQLKKYYTTISV